IRTISCQYHFHSRLTSGYNVNLTYSLFSPRNLTFFHYPLMSFHNMQVTFYLYLAVTLMSPRAYFSCFILVSVSLFMSPTSYFLLLPSMAPLLITSPRWSCRPFLSGSHFLVLRSIMLAFSEYFSVLGSPIDCLHDIFPVYSRRSFLFRRGANL